MSKNEDRPHPVIILVEPQLGENIGAAARAMANFGLSELRLVRPRDGWPSDKARAAASRADHIIDRTTVFDRLEDAIADLSFLFATTRRERDMLKPVRGPMEAADLMAAETARGARIGVLFGRERWGLENDEVALADEILTLPVDPDFASLNIAQAVLIVAYEWRKSMLGGDAVPFTTPDEATRPADKADLMRLFEHLESALEGRNYFRPPEKRPTMVRNIRTMLQRARLTGGEVQTFRGVIAALEGRKTRPRKAGREPSQNHSETAGRDGGSGGKSDL